MPYNPSSAYPRHSTYTPPVYNRGFARGFNEVDWGQRFGHPTAAPGVDVNHALRAALRPNDTAATRLGLEAQGRTGFGTMGMNKANAWARGKREEYKAQQRRAAGGDGPNEENPPPFLRQNPAGPGPTFDPERFYKENEVILGWQNPGAGMGTSPGGSSSVRGGRDPLLDTDPNPGDFAAPSETGGRAHVAPPTDRLGAIVQRVTTSSAMNNTVNRVLSGSVGGPMTVPKLVFGAARAVNRRRK